MKHYSASIARALMRHLRKDNTQALTFDAKHGKIEFLRPGHGRIAYFAYTILLGAKGYSVMLRCPVTPDSGDAETVAAIAKYLAYVNKEMGFGANGGHLEGYFDLNCNSGMIEFRFFVEAYMHLTASVIRDSIEWSGADMDRAVPGILDILFRGATPEAAMADYSRRMENVSEVTFPKLI